MIFIKKRKLNWFLFFIVKNRFIGLTYCSISDRLNVIQTGNRVVEEKPDKPVKVTKEKLDNSEKLNTFDEGKPKAKAEKASKLNKAEKDAETFAENSEKVTKTAEPIIQSTNKEQSRYEAAQEIVKKAEARQLSENEKAEIAAEYINKAGIKIPQEKQPSGKPQIDDNIYDIASGRYRQIPEKEIAPAMEEVVNQHEEIKAAEATAAKPAEPIESIKPELKESDKQKDKQASLGFDGDSAKNVFGTKQDFEEFVQEKNK